jgi:hypothetical protein
MLPYCFNPVRVKHASVHVRKYVLKSKKVIFKVSLKLSVAGAGTVAERNITAP